MNIAALRWLIDLGCQSRDNQSYNGQESEAQHEDPVTFDQNHIKEG